MPPFPLASTDGKSTLEAVNLVLITKREATEGIDAADPRATHLIQTVGLRVGQSFHVGIAGALRGLAEITAVAPVLTFNITWERAVQAKLPLTVIVGLPRPQTAKKVLHDLASLGVSRIIFFEAEKGDPGYLSSSLWQEDEWQSPLRKGTEQACSTLVPEVLRTRSLEAALALITENNWLVALDPYEALGALGEAPAGSIGGTLAIGPERGWSDAERKLLVVRGFALHHLGDRILRVEAACLVGGALMLARLHVWARHRNLDA